MALNWDPGGRDGRLTQKVTINGWEVTGYGDSQCSRTILSKGVTKKLRLKQMDQKRAELADGTVKLFPIASVTISHSGGDEFQRDVFIEGNETLLGSDIFAFSARPKHLTEDEDKDPDDTVFAASDRTRPAELLSDLRDSFNRELPSSINKPATLAPMDIVVDGPPPAAMPRRFDPLTTEVIEKQMIEWLDLDVVTKKGTVLATSAVVPVRQKQKTRICVDYRPLNRITVLDPLDFPTTSELLEKVATKRYFVQLDLVRGYNQIPLTLRAGKLAAIVTETGVFIPKRVMFGLKNAPTHFQREMVRLSNQIRRPGLVVAVYLDDIVIAADDLELLRGASRELLSIFVAAGLVVNFDKSVFGAEEITFLGHRIRKGEKGLATYAIRAIRELPSPANKPQLDLLIGKVGYYSHLIPSAGRAQNCWRASYNKKKVQWTAECENWFTKVKSELGNSFVPLDTPGELVVKTDASKEGCGGIIEINGKLAYVTSHKFSTAESNWSTVQQEMFGVLWTLTRPVVKQMCLLRPFRICTDHLNITYLMNKSVEDSKLLRWTLKLMEFPFLSVEHIPGENNVLADALSRLHAIQDTKESPDTIGGALVETEPILKAAHALHVPATRMMQNLKSQGIHWPGLQRDCKDYVRRCDSCQRAKRPSTGTGSELLDTLKSENVFKHIALDTIVMGHTADKHGYKYVHVAIDCFTKAVELRAAKNNTAEQVSEVVLEVIRRYGKPEVITSDQGSEYANAVVRAITDRFAIDHRMTIPFRPWANGIVERAIQEVKKHLRALTTSLHTLDSWSKLIPWVQYLMMSARHSATTKTPRELLFGEGIAPLPEEERIEQLRTIRQAAAIHLRAERAKRLSKANEDREATSFELGDLVLIYDQTRSHSLAPFYIGPFKIVEEVRNSSDKPIAYKCQDLLDTSRLLERSMEHLKDYNVPDSYTDDDIQILAARSQASEVIEKILLDTEDPANARRRLYLTRFSHKGPYGDRWLTSKELVRTRALDEYKTKQLRSRPKQRSKSSVSSSRRGSVTARDDPGFYERSYASGADRRERGNDDTIPPGDDNEQFERQVSTNQSVDTLDQ